MKKYLFVFLLISGIVGLPVILYNNYLNSDLYPIFILDSDNYDILEFISPDNNAIYVIFLLVNLFLVSFILFKNYFNKLPLSLGIYQPTNFTSKFHTRSPPLA
ncbi:MAG: hypothetical protein QW367_01190 [Candidatus Aenigmatarchaeota archaeon]